MRKLLPFILVALMSCASSGVYQHNFGSMMMVTSDVLYSKVSFDSMCGADGLPSELSEWDSMFTRDYDTKSAIVIHYLYSGNDSSEVLYKVERKDSDEFKVNKREILK